MITTTERQENLIDQHAAMINPSQARVMREAGLGIIESRREGAYVWDQSGTRYIDCRQETSVYNVGRHNKFLVDKLKRALNEYDLGNSLFFSEPRVHLARRLGEISPGGQLRAVTYGVSGGEVNDFALKLARAQTGREKVIAMNGGYHGSTAFSASASGVENFRNPFGPLVPGVKYADFGSLSSLEQLIDKTTACVILETVQTLAGIRVPTARYLQGVRELCDKFGAFMILDENETCLGRTGAMFAIQTLAPRVVPDILTMGKSLGGGLFPISAALYREEHLDFWDRYPFSHQSTFAGSDLGCVMGLETLDYCLDHDLAGLAKERSLEFALGFAKLKRRYSKVLKRVRICGLAMALDFHDELLGPQMSRDLSQFGVLASCSQFNTATMFLLPTLTLSSTDVQTILEAFACTLAGAQSILNPAKFETLESLMHS